MTPLPAQHGAHDAPTDTLRMQLAIASRMTTTGDRTQLRMVGTIALPGTGIASHLAGMISWRAVLLE